MQIASILRPWKIPTIGRQTQENAIIKLIEIQPREKKRDRKRYEGRERESASKGKICIAAKIKIIAIFKHEQVENEHFDLIA